MKTNLFLTAALSLSLCAASTAQTLPAYLPTDGLVGWWPFNGNANDESGNGNDGTVNGATLTEDRFGNANNAYSFNGFSNHITVLDNDNLDLVNNFTISCWFKASELNEVNMIISKHDAIFGDNFGTYTMGLWMVDQNSVINCQASPNLNNQTFPPANVGGVQIEDWRNFLVTYSDSLDVLKYYLDGILVHTINIIFNVQNTELPFRIGANMNNGLLYHFFAGSLDDIGVWNRVLSTQEIANIYSDEPVTPPTTCNPLPANLQNGLVGYWPFCGNANDESGNGNDGTVNGATLTEDRFGVANAAYDFDGDQDFIVVDNENNFDFETEFSINAWFKLNSTNLGQKFIVTKFQNFDDSYALYTSNSAIAVQVASAPTQWTELTGSNEIDTLEWANVSLVLSNQTLKIFLNGQEEAVLPYAQTIFNSQAPIVFGDFFGNNWNTGAAFDGKIDDIAIYNRALTPDEVQQLYTLNACTFTIYDTTNVTIYDTVSVSVSTTDTLIINTLITAVEPAQENTFLVYPNPASTQITINNGNVSILGGYTMRISNSLGQDVYNQNITQPQVTLDLSTWGGNGLYVLYIVDPQQNIVAVKQIVLQ